MTLSLCVCARSMWCWSCGRLVSVWIMVNSETTMILAMPTSLRQSGGGKIIILTCSKSSVVSSWVLRCVYRWTELMSALRLCCFPEGRTLTTLIPCPRPLSTCREIPLELRQRSRGGQVNLDMEDHRDEDFAKPKVAFKAFGGEGQKLGRWE